MSKETIDTKYGDPFASLDLTYIVSGTVLLEKKQIFETSETLREHERVMTEDKKYKNHQGFDAY